jgi:5-methylcytosine-specific restriction endonuclease McrBC regulatory subunit McrC
MDKIKLKDFSKEIVKNKNLYDKVKNGSVLFITTSDCETVNEKKDKEPILQIEKSQNENEVIITTFGYIGRFSAFKVEFDITYRFGKTLLGVMINKVNDFEVRLKDLENKKSSKKNQNDDVVMYMLYLNFILKLQKLSILGVVKTYIKKEYNDRFKGQVDINRFIKKNIPFQGKIASNSYEQVYVQEIVDVLYCALDIVENKMRNLVFSKIAHLRNLLHHHSNKRIVDENTIQKALNHKALQNSLYSSFKDTIKLASYIIRHNLNIEQKSRYFLQGLVFDVSLLWEAYLYKLLKENFEKDNWSVIHEEHIQVYENNFFKRTIKPDIVIKNETKNQIMVFDAKSKKMTFQGSDNFGMGDLDREDFFQIHTYISYYKNNEFDVIAGGLLYPIEANYDKNKCFSQALFGKNSDTKFIVDGIELFKAKSIKSIKCREKRFIDRIKNLFNQT